MTPPGGEYFLVFLLEGNIVEDANLHCTYSLRGKWEAVVSMYLVLGSGRAGTAPLRRRLPGVTNGEISTGSMQVSIKSAMKRGLVYRRPALASLLTLCHYAILQVQPNCLGPGKLSVDS